MLDKDQKLQLVLKPMIQIKQAGGLRILWVDMANVEIASDSGTCISMMAAQATQHSVQNSVQSSIQSSIQSSAQSSIQSSAQSSAQSPVTDLDSTGSSSRKSNVTGTGPAVDTNRGRWYLTLKNNVVTATQTKTDPYVVERKTKLTIDMKCGSGPHWIIIHTSFMKTTLSHLDAVRKEVHGRPIMQMISVGMAVDSKELKFRDMFVLSKRQAVGADSTVLLLLQKPIELDGGGRLTLEFRVGAQINQGGGFKVLSIELLSTALKSKAIGAKDVTVLERYEDSHSKCGGAKKGSAVEQKIRGDSQACSSTSSSTSVSTSGTPSNSSRSAPDDATSPINGAAGNITSRSSGIANDAIHSPDDDAACSSIGAVPNSGSTINIPSSTSNSAIVSPTISAANSKTNSNDASIAECSQPKPLAPAPCHGAAKSSIKPTLSACATAPIAVKGTSNFSSPESNKATKEQSATPAVEPKPAAPTDQTCKEVSKSSSEFVKIDTYKIDKSGTRLATLSFGKKFFYLDVWDIEDALHNPGMNGKKVKIDTEAGRVPHSSSSSTQWRQVASVKKQIGLELLWNHHKNMTVAVSFGANQIALIPHSVQEFSKPQSFLLFGCNLTKKTFVDEDPQEDLKWFVGYGDFCCPLLDDGQPDTAQEKFLTCDGYSVAVYHCPAGRPWTLLWNIPLLEAPPRSPTQSVIHKKQQSVGPRVYPGAYSVCKRVLPTPAPTNKGLTLAKKLIQSVRHRYFAWTGYARAVTIWDFMAGNLVSYIPHPDERKFMDICTYLSVDGSVTVVWYRGHGIVGTYWTASGVCIKTYRDKAGVFEGQFLVSENLLSSDSIALQKTRSHLVSLLDGSKRHLAKDLRDLKGNITISATGGQSLVRVQGALVTVTGLDTAFAKISNDWECKPTCGSLASERLSEKRFYDAKSKSDSGVVFDFCRKSGARFVMERTRVVSGQVLYTLKLIFKVDPKESTLLIFSHEFKYAMLTAEAEHLVLVDEKYVQIWMIPSVFGYNCRLLLAWAVNPGTGSDGFWREPFEPRLCGHSRILSMDMRKTGQSMTINLSDPKVFSEKTAGRFLGGMQLLMDMYTSMLKINKHATGFKRDSLALAVSKYLAGYINHNPTPHEPLNTVLAQICRTWTFAARDTYNDILRKILDTNKCWSPAPCYRSYKDRDGNTISSNPISILLRMDDACVIGTAKVLYKYCLQRAHDTGQIGYLAPVLDSLPLLFLQHRSHALKYFREMALIKAMEASFLREVYSIVEHTAEGRWCHQQLEDTPPHSIQSDDLDNTDEGGDKGAGEVYGASYDMLWEYSDYEAKEDEMPTQSLLGGTLAQGLRLLGRSYIKRHQFCREFLDNPAIEALIEQKWTTIGFQYWCVCFISQFYVFELLLHIVLGQLYGSDAEELYGDFVAVATSSVFFLWPKIIQVLYEADEEASLGYNIVGVMAFSMPLAGSVNQIWIVLGGKVLNASYLFSLSLVVFSLHLLFELRVFRNVYKLVSMLVAIVSGLKTLLLVLTLSIVVFGTAILHAIGLPSTATVAVPRTLYFLMFLFVFFAVIMILYILLDLMNTNYKRAEAEWLLNWNQHRLCCVERAENWTMIIPGFRKGRGTVYTKHVFFSPAPSDVQAFTTRYPSGLTLPPRKGQMGGGGEVTKQ
ncbi:unnamed protein product [Mortierella alpina]